MSSVHRTLARCIIHRACVSEIYFNLESRFANSPHDDQVLPAGGITTGQLATEIVARATELPEGSNQFRLSNSNGYEEAYREGVIAASAITTCGSCSHLKLRWQFNSHREVAITTGGSRILAHTPTRGYTAAIATSRNYHVHSPARLL